MMQVEVQFPYGASVDAVKERDPCYCWAETGVEAFHKASTKTTLIEKERAASTRYVGSTDTMSGGLIMVGG